MRRRLQRDGEDQASTSERAGCAGDVAIVGPSDLAEDGETQSGSTVGAVAGFVETGEAVEDDLALVRWNSGAVVVDRDDGMVVVDGQRDAGAAASVAHRVVQQVPDGSGDELLVAVDPHRSSDVDIDGVGLSERFSGHQIIEVDIGAGARSSLIKSR